MSTGEVPFVQQVVSVLETMGDAFLALDREWRIIYINRQAQKLLERLARDLVGRDFWTEFPATAGTNFQQECRRAMKDGVATRFDGFYAPLNRWFEVNAHPSPEGLALYFRDISDRKRVEAQLRETQWRYRALIELAPQMIWSASRDGAVEFFNERWYAYTGQAPGGGEGWGWKPVIHPDDLDRTLEQWSRSVTSGDPYEIEYRLKRADGQYRWHLARALALRDFSGRVVRWFGVCTDIHDTKTAQQEAREAREEAERASRAKDHFLAALSHELRTPLTPVTLTVDSLLSEDGLPAGLRPDLEMVKRNIDLEARLIDDLLDLSRIINNKLSLNLQATSVHPLVQNVAGIVAHEAESKHLQMAWELKAEHDAVHADPARLQQVLWNLLSNAIKFTPEGGRITTRTRNEEGAIVIEVSDTGIGIDPELVGKLFNAFEQGERAITRRFGGLGLGLAISRALVDMHGGSISAASDGKGKGTTFTIRLPMARAGAALDGVRPEPIDGKSMAPHERPVRVLVVEDHADTLRLLEKLLQRAGFSVAAASTVAGAVEQVEKRARTHQEIEVMVSDVGLPDGTGLELMQRLRANGFTAPAIAMTGYGMEQDVRAALDAGFREHMAKPLDVRRLAEAIRRLGQEARARADVAAGGDVTARG